MGSFQSAPHHFVDRRKGTPEYIMIICLGGKGTCSVSSKRYELSMGHAIVLPPGLPHRYWADEKDPWRLLWVHFEGRRGEDYFEMLGMSRRKPVFWLHDLALVSEAFEECFRHILGGHTDAELFALSSSLVRFLGVCRLAQRSLNLRRRQAEDRVLRTLQHMREHIAQPLTLAQLATVAHWTPTHYSAVFKRQLNLSPIEYLLRLKMQRACELLRSTDSRIADIAASLGYEDAFYFSRLFHRRIGETPRSYRRRVYT
jgi:AraC-like DNA-binding protein